MSSTTSCRPVGRPRRRRGEAGAEDDRARRSGRGQLHDPEVRAGGEVGVLAPPQRLVEGLGPVHIGHRHDDNFKLHVHGRLLSGCRGPYQASGAGWNPSPRADSSECPDLSDRNGRWFHVVVDAHSGQQPIGGTLEDADAGLGRQIAGRPSRRSCTPRAKRTPSSVTTHGCRSTPPPALKTRVKYARSSSLPRWVTCGPIGSRK